MQYQTFRGADMRDALNRVKATLGPDAVIETARRVSNRRGGALQQDFVEIRAGSASAVATSGPFSPDVGREQALQRSRQSGSDAPIPVRLDIRRREPNSTSVASNGVTAGTPTPSTAELDQELRSLRAMVEELRATRKPKERALALLHEAGFEGALARELAIGSHRVTRHAGASLRDWVVSRIAQRLPTSPGLITLKDRQLVACIGPSGAGKTTTLAKLAARAKLEHNRSVGIVTLDTYRVGAVEQWQRYSQLLRTPFAIARTREEFEATVKSSTCELLFVDTSGRTLGEHESGWVLPQFLARVSKYQVHALLVLPAWLRARDAERVARAYCDTPATGAVITKMDETMHRGGALQAIIANALPLAYTCDGPRVPEDIRDASLEGALNGLLAAEA